MLVNNNFPNAVVDMHIRKFIAKKRPNNTQANEQTPTEESSPEENSDIDLYYRNQMTRDYKQDENNLRRIIRSNVKPTSEAQRINLIIYYKNRKLKNVIIKNNPNKPTEESNVIYKYSCNVQSCKETDEFYVGMTTVTLKERFKQHSAIKKHFEQTHMRNITGSQMTRNVSVIARRREKEDLSILEALLIKRLNPSINRQSNDFGRTLKVFR